MTNSLPNAHYGEQTPSLRNVPPYITSAGPEAIKLAASCGLILDPWQAKTLTDALGEGPDGKWVSSECGVIVSRQNGKGSLLEARVLAGLLLFGEKLIVWTAHEAKTSNEALRRIAALIDNSPELKKLVKSVKTGNNDQSIEFTTGARIRFITRTKGSGRGFSGDCVILDEAYALTDEMLEALMPTMSAKPNPQIWYTSSPPLASDTGDVLFRLRDRALSQDRNLAYFDWGVQNVDLGDLSTVDLDDPVVWAKANPALGYRLSLEFTKRERASMSDAGFARERLGIWPPRHAGTSIINMDVWQGLAYKPALTPEELKSTVDLTKLTLAVSVSQYRDYSTIAMYAPRNDGLEHVQILKHSPGTDWVVRSLVHLRDKWNPVAIAIDRKNPAWSLALDLANAGIREPSDVDNPKFGDLAVTGAEDMASACGQLLDAINQKQIRHPDQPPLNLAVGGVKTRPLVDAWAWSGRASNVDIGPLIAITLARWAYLTRVDQVTADYDILMSAF